MLVTYSFTDLNSGRAPSGLPGFLLLLNSAALGLRLQSSSLKMAKKKLKPGEVSGYLDQIENDDDEGLYETDETDDQSSDFSEDDEYPTDGEDGEKENTNFNDDGEEINAESTLKSYSEHDRRLDESDVEMVEEPSNEIRKETSISSTVEKISIENGESSQAEAAVKKGNKLLNWHGERLFPPSTTGKVKSSVWLHGGFPKDKSGKLKMEHSICSYCGAKIAHHSSPANLKKHLEKFHPEEFSSKTPKSKANNLITNLFVQKVKKYPQDNKKQKRFRAQLVKWIIKRHRAFKMLNDVEFHELIGIADPQLTVISPQTLKRDIESLYEKKVMETKEEFKEVDYFCCTNDGGSTSDARSFLSIIVTYMKVERGNLELKKKTLGMTEMYKGKTAAVYRKEVDEVLDSFGIKEKTCVFITDNEPMMKKAFKSQERNGCFPHISSKVCEKALERQECLKDLRLKLRKIATKFNSSPKFKLEVESEQKMRVLAVRVLSQEVATRFTATQIMIKSFMNDPNEKTEFEADVESVKRNIDAINSAMENIGVKGTDLKELKITEADITKMLQLMKVLEILEEGVALAGGHEYETASVMLKYLRFLFKFLEPVDEDPSYLSRFKLDIKKEFQERCDANLNYEILGKAAFFDRRNDMAKVLCDDSQKSFEKDEDGEYIDDLSIDEKHVSVLPSSVEIESSIRSELAKLQYQEGKVKQNLVFLKLLSHTFFCRRM